MSQLEVDKIIPQSGTTLTIGDSGDTVNFADGTNLSIDTNTLYIDSTNNRVGIANSSPSVALDVTGAAKVSGDLTVDTNTLKVDSSNNKVGIGTTTLPEVLTVNKSSNGAITGLSINNDYPTSSTASAGTGSGIRFGVNDGTFNSAFGDGRGSEILSVTASTNGRSRDIVFKTDNGGTLGEVMRIDSSGDVYIGNQDSAASSAFFNKELSNEYKFNIYASTSTSTSRAITFNGRSNSEAMRIDSSGRLILAKTSTAIGDVGISLDSNGKISATRSSDPVFLLNRLSTDGVIADFRKDGTTVGSISTDNSSNLTIQGKSSSDFSILFGTNKLNPKNYAGTGAKDNAVDLGDNDDRWKDLYLGGGLYVGGTGTANKLDDYEEGTFTPIIKFGGGTTGISATQVGKYTKVGNLVTLQIFIEFSNKGSSTGAATISGIPFTIATLTNSWSGVGTAPLVWHNMTSSLVQAGVTVNRSSQFLTLFGHTASNGNGTNQALTNTDFANNSYIGITAAYLST